MICGNAEDLLATYRAVTKEFNVVEGSGRIKMNFRRENNLESADGKPPDV